MTRRRWIADEVSGRRAALTGAHADHLIRVLRARLGQEFDVSAGSVVYRARVATIGNQRVEFELEEELAVSLITQISLVLAVIKFDRMEWAIEKCTELGISRFIPLLAARTDTHLASASSKRVERWRRIAREAAEQSRRISPPAIDNPLKLDEVVALSQYGICLSESDKANPLIEVMRTRGKQNELFLAIGPEGGWTESEGKLFSDWNWTSASLGATILRAETAAIAATAIAAQLQ